MNKQINILICSILFYLQCIAQTDVRVTDTTLRRELSITQYSKDTSAGAILLYDYGRVTILDNNYDRKFRRFYMIKQRIKILNQSGFRRAKFNIVLYKNLDEQLANVDAVTYNLEGNKIISSPLKSTEIFEDKESKSVVVKKFEMPDVKSGSVIYVCYTIQSNNIENFNWYFQGNIPVVLSQFDVSVPPFYVYKSIEQEIDTTCIRNKVLDVSDNDYTRSYTNSIYSYELRNIPAFKDESFITTPQDYLVKISFQLSMTKSRDMVQKKAFVSTWPELNKALLENNWLGGYLKSESKEMKKIVEQLKLNGKSDLEKAECIVNYVKTNYKWNNEYGFFAQKDKGDFLEQKIGNSANINLLLVSLFTAAKMNAYPVILSTRGHGKIKANYPFASFFNDVICYVKSDSISMLVDGTRPLLPYYTIPPECINDYGLIVEMDSTEWVVLKSPVVSKTKESMILKFTPAGDSIKGYFALKATGYDAFKYRQLWYNGYEKIEAALTHRKDGVMDSIKVINENDLEKPFIITFSESFPMNINKEDSSSAISGQISFPPFLAEVFIKNPLTMPDRKYPVDLVYKPAYEYSSTISIPNGYKIYQKPEDISYFMPDDKATFLFKLVQPAENSIQVISTITLNCAIYQPEDYKELKKYFDVIANKYTEEIILRKK